MNIEQINQLDGKYLKKLTDFEEQVLNILTQIEINTRKV